MTWSELKVAVKLVLAHARHRPGRVLLTSLSTVAAACVVVWVVSGYDSLVGQFGGMGEEYVGRYELLLLPTRGGESADGGGDMASAPGPGGFGGPRLQLSKDFLNTVRQDPDVALVEPAYETTLRAGKVGGEPAEGGRGRLAGAKSEDKQATKAKASGPIMMGGVAQQRAQNRTPTIVGTDSAVPLHTLVKGAWFDPKNAGARDGAITREAADFLGVEPGDEVVVTGFGMGKDETRIKIAAVVEQPKRLPGPRFMVGLPPTRQGVLPGGPATHALYVPTALAEKLSGAPARASYAGVVLRSGVKTDDFLTKWAERFSTATPPVDVRTPGKVDSEVENSTTFDTVRAQAYSATGISLLAALFIIFTTLSMGVDERARQFAVLRAISLTKMQIASMVAIESVMLGLLGWAGGLLAGWGLLKIMARVRPEALAEGAELGTWCVVLSGACALGGSLAASILPAWRATSVSPLEAMAPRRPVYSGRLPWVLTVAGLVLIAVNPLVVFFVPMPDTSRYIISAAAGCTTMTVGFILLVPVAVVLTERVLGPVLARLLWLNPRLLATQLSSNMWRTAGTAVAMTIGLGLFVTMQIWGYSMLGPFTPGDWAPDLVVSIGPGGVPDSDVDAVRHVPGLVADKFLPLAVKQVKFSEDVTGYKVRPSATRQDSCVMIGFDPDAALGGDSPPFKFSFVEGARDEAIAKLKKGRYCLVPDHFARESGLGVGQKFAVLPPDDPDSPLEYEIAGVVAMPGWHWLTKSGFRRGRAAGLMFCSRDVVRTDFTTGRTTLFWGTWTARPPRTRSRQPFSRSRTAASTRQPPRAAAGRGERAGQPPGALAANRRRRPSRCNRPKASEPRSGSGPTTSSGP
ncbi:ABC transporter permease [Fimbriiglobus ruber]|uniref:Putative ABC transporter integral membrane protein n=1 Tax=Fimbriiglobus ruber TaxID=1908690 RepID=A0A225D860_9BACT|nr:ABC transporter permease [Fimbriiglobus ruber]OWK35814.1 putative ABC transporter integral membrane protein [Fimbriiglobus ruber]